MIINVIIFVFCLINSGAADEVLGCNGFIKSDIDIKYSSVVVKLFTKQGSLKDHTECAPNNGYYFIPLYDKGEFVLKVSPPPGWKFEPTEVPLVIDGASDPCSLGKDINFFFKGFVLSGQVVSYGHSVGPHGVSVRLFKTSSHGAGEPLLETTTSAGGRYLFEPVKPGSYIVQASHPKWKLAKNQTVVEVNLDNTEVQPGSLSIAGYDVSGSVTSEGQPITGVSFVLFTDKTLKPIPSGCHGLQNLEAFSGVGLELDEYHPICYVQSDAKGRFSFLEIPPGDYVLVPHYKSSKSTKFDVHPRKLPFNVNHGSVKLSPTFEVKGFTASGKVFWGPDGLPMDKATIFINGKQVGITGPDGSYSLENMRAGTYRIFAKARDVMFTESELKVTSTVLPDIYPTSYKVCGKLHSPSSSGPYQVDITGADGQLSKVNTDSSGDYCTYLTPGKYTVIPFVDRAQKNHGLLFSPVSRTVDVIDSVILNVNFSHLRSTVTGKIKCMSICPLITVNLKPHSSGKTLQTIAKAAIYEFNDVLPGEYDVYIEPGLGWCWEKETQQISVNKELTTGPTFVQSGFTVTIISTHVTKVMYYSESSPNENQTMTVSPGSTHLCVPKTGPYVFVPSSCHGFKEQVVRWLSGPVRLSALTHLNVFAIQSPELIPDLMIEAVQGGKQKSLVKPVLVSDKPSESGYRYEISLQLEENDEVNLSPQGGLFLFSPTTAQVFGAGDCVNESRPIFIAEKGLVVSGRVITANNESLGDVLIRIRNELDKVVTSMRTLPDGTYKFYPIKKSSSYKITAEKDGYEITEMDKPGFFSAHKLAEIIVEVKDKEQGAMNQESEYHSLQGVLLSLSGGESYRRNAHTNYNGTLSFLSLSPGEYFLRPRAKEYKFHPAHRTIQLEEGATVKVNFISERVAYSGFGTVTSLSGEGENGVVVEAVGTGSCHQLQEEATSSPSGSFTILGLQPNCVYNVMVKKGIDINQHIQFSMPEHIPITVGRSDIEGLHLYAMRPITRTDVAVYVVPERPEDLRTLKVKLTREDAPDVTLHTIKLSEYKGTSAYQLKTLLLTLPPLPADGRGYIVQLESTLSQATHSYTNRPVHFKATSSFKMLRLNFDPKPKFREPELSQSSYFFVPFLIIALMVAYNRDSLTSKAASVSQFLMGGTRVVTSDDLPSDPVSDLIPKRKTKSRKT